MRPEMGKEQAVHVTLEVEADVGFLDSHGTREDISDFVGLDCGSFDGDDCVWDGKGRDFPLGTLIVGSGRLFGGSGSILIAGIDGVG